MTRRRPTRDEDWGIGDRRPSEQLPAKLSSPGEKPLMPASFVEKVREVEEHLDAKNTKRAYASDWRIFSAWCSSHGVKPAPASTETIMAFLIDAESGGIDGEPRSPATLQRYLASISTAHRRKGHPSPWNDQKVRDALKALKRKAADEGTSRQRKVRPLLPEQLERIATPAPETPRGKRDLAILLLGFGGAFRRSELAAIRVEHLTFGRTAAGREEVRVFLPSSKTDQAGVGETVAVPGASVDSPACPVRALRAWLEAAAITEGPVFRGVHRSGKIFARAVSDSVVALVVKKAVAAIGLDPAEFAGHSLRSGLATAAAIDGKRLDKIMQQTRHKDAKTAMGYVRDAELSNEDNAAAGLLD